MRLNLLLFSAVMLTALAAALFAAVKAVDLIEARSQAGVEAALMQAGLDWPEVDVDGLRVGLSGTAPDEAARFAAVRAAGTVVDAERVVDAMDVAAAQVIAPPRFSVEILRNGDGISVIGLFPEAEDRDGFLRRIETVAAGAIVTDLMESSGFPAPDNWAAATTFGTDALEQLPRAKISIAADRVAITAMAEDDATRQALEQGFTETVPEGVALSLDISAPRPVITPFTFRVVADAAGPRFDACTASTETGMARILTAAEAIGIDSPACRVGLGAPSPDWADAVIAGLSAMDALGPGTLTYSDTDVSLVGHETTPQALFDQEVGTLEAALPAAFSLTTVLPRPQGDADDGPPSFTATRSPEGLIQLRGHVVDAGAKQALSSFAVARFGAGQVSDGTRVATDLPAGWSPRLIAGLDALTLLHNGAVQVDPDQVAVRGTSGHAEARAEIARLLSGTLGEGASYTIDVAYERRFDPTLNIPTPENCVERINAALGARKITFAPGSGVIDPSATGTLDSVAEILKDCRDTPLEIEIGGHTDSQGREVMNKELSQERAEAVIAALRERRVPTARITARGYGEEFPIADNGTPEGREANRRIEVKLILPEAPSEAATDDTDILTGGGSESDSNE